VTDGQTDGRRGGIAIANTSLAMQALRRAVKIGEVSHMVRLYERTDIQTRLSRYFSPPPGEGGEVIIENI